MKRRFNSCADLTGELNGRKFALPQVYSFSSFSSIFVKPKKMLNEMLITKNVNTMGEVGVLSNCLRNMSPCVEWGFFYLLCKLSAVLGRPEIFHTNE